MQPYLTISFVCRHTCPNYDPNLSFKMSEYTLSNWFYSDSELILAMFSLCTVIRFICSLSYFPCNKTRFSFTTVNSTKFFFIHSYRLDSMTLHSLVAVTSQFRSTCVVFWSSIVPWHSVNTLVGSSLRCHLRFHLPLALCHVRMYCFIWL